MELSALQYISDQQGHTTGVVVPIELWKEIQRLLISTPPDNVAAPSHEPEARLIQKGGVWVAQVTATGNLETAIEEMRARRITQVWAGRIA